VGGYQKEFTIVHQSWSPEHIHVIIITTTNRQNTDKQKSHEGQQRKGGQMGLEHKHN